MALSPINKRIENTDIYVFSKGSAKSTFTYSRPLSLDESNAVATDVNASIASDYARAKGLRDGLSVDKKTAALYNMNLFKGILANKALMRQSKGSLWFPTIQEGLLLHGATMLPSGELMDFGLVVYSEGDPNPELARSLIAQLSQKINFQHLLHSRALLLPTQEQNMAQRRR